MQKECRKDKEHPASVQLEDFSDNKEKFGEKFGVTRLLSSGWILAGPVPENYPGTVN
jgi:hypothetical protein